MWLVMSDGRIAEIGAGPVGGFKRDAWAWI